MDNNRYLRYANVAGNFLLRLVPVAGEYMDNRAMKIKNNNGTNKTGEIIDMANNSFCRVSGLGSIAAGVFTHDPLFIGVGAAIYGMVTAGHEYRYLRNARRETDR